MKRANHLMEKAVEPENLRLAFWKAKKGKSHSPGVLAYQANLECNLARLRQQMTTGLVEVGDYRFFKVFDPKERQICAPAFREQVLHHALMNVCHEYFERYQVFDSYASRKGKGTHAALARAKYFTRKFPWFLKLDVRQFFASIHHEMLKEQMERLFKDVRLLDIFGKIIDSYEAQPGIPKAIGMPIGNLSSQYFANHYLAGLDHFIKERLRIKGYVRYMDDMVLWADGKAELKQTFHTVRDFIAEKLRCKLKPELLNRATFGLPFLGYLVFPHQVKLSQRSKRRFAKKWKILAKNYQSGEWSQAVCQRHALPLIAFTAHADAVGFRSKIG